MTILELKKFIAEKVKNALKDKKDIMASEEYLNDNIQI